MLAKNSAAAPKDRRAIHLIAHSMGNRGLLRALQRIAADAQSAANIKFGQIFLAAPDLDRELFLDLAHLYPRYSERTTLYASDTDRAVHASSRLHEAPRAGYFKPFTLAPRIDTICVPGFDVDLLGVELGLNHSYFAEALAMLHDINQLIFHNTPPEGRKQGLAPMNDGENTLWRIKR